jgi:hypothetical protein
MSDMGFELSDLATGITSTIALKEPLPAARPSGRTAGRVPFMAFPTLLHEPPAHLSGPSTC